MATIELLGVGRDVPARRSGEAPTRVLGAIDLTVTEGELLVLVGPSGCGKSTLLRCIAGLDPITRGGPRIGGRRANDLLPGERDLAMVFQSYALYPHLTVRDNLAFALRLRHMPEPELRLRVDEAAAMLEIAPLLDRLPAQLSG